MSALHESAKMLELLSSKARSKIVKAVAGSLLNEGNDETRNREGSCVVRPTGNRRAGMVKRRGSILLATAGAETPEIAPGEGRMRGGISRLKLKGFLQQRYRLCSILFVCGRN